MWRFVTIVISPTADRRPNSGLEPAALVQPRPQLASWSSGRCGGRLWRKFTQGGGVRAWRM